MIKRISFVGIGVVVVTVLIVSVLPQSIASELARICAGDSSCYEKEISRLYPARSLSDIFGIIREIRQLDPSYQFCHVLAHKLGEAAVAEDPARWIELIPYNPSNSLCSNGFIHGIIVGRFRNDTLDTKTMMETMPDLKRACERRMDWSPTSLDQAICYHGMGHLFMFVTNADIPRSLDACNEIGQSPTGDFLRVCREGVFMQIYQPLEPDDLALIELLPEKPSRENYRAMCARYGRNAEETGACLREAWPMFRDEIFAGDAATFCAGQPTLAEEDACYESVSAIIGRQLLGAKDGGAICASFPQDRQLGCHVALAQTVLEEDGSKMREALAVCARAPESLAPHCMGELAVRAPWIYGNGTLALRSFCAMIPPEYRLLCASR